MRPIHLMCLLRRRAHPLGSTMGWIPPQSSPQLSDRVRVERTHQMNRRGKVYQNTGRMDTARAAHKPRKATNAGSAATLFRRPATRSQALARAFQMGFKE